MNAEAGYAAALGDGSLARAVALAGEVVQLIAERAYPPGQPLAFSLQLEGGALALQGKSAGSKRREDGRFEVRVRLHSLRRDQRDRLRALTWS